MLKYKRRFFLECYLFPIFSGGLFSTSMQLYAMNAIKLEAGAARRSGDPLYRAVPTSMRLHAASATKPAVGAARRSGEWRNAAQSEANLERSPR